MRSILLLAVLPACLAAAPFAIVKPVVAQSEGGDALPASFKHGAGETLFFSCNISGFTKSNENQINLAYSVQAFDPKGVPVAEIYNGTSKESVGPEDTEWLPTIETQIVLPDILLPGAYKIVVKAEDLLNKEVADLTVPLEIGGRNVTASPTLILKDFRWFHNEEEQQPMNQPLYHAGNSMFMRFVIAGYKYGEKNKVDVSYTPSLVLESGKTIWSQPEA